MRPFFAALIAVGYMAAVFIIFGAGPKLLAKLSVLKSRPGWRLHPR
jgi:hypothetical protein